MDALLHLLRLPCLRKTHHFWVEPRPGQPYGCGINGYAIRRCRLPKRCHL